MGRSEIESAAAWWVEMRDFLVSVFTSDQQLRDFLGLYANLRADLSGTGTSLRSLALDGISLLIQAGDARMKAAFAGLRREFKHRTDEIDRLERGWQAHKDDITAPPPSINVSTIRGAATVRPAAATTSSIHASPPYTQQWPPRAGIALDNSTVGDQAVVGDSAQGSQSQRAGRDIINNIVIEAPRPASQPPTQYASDRDQALSEELKRLYRQRALAHPDEVSGIQEQILHIRRQLRDGPQLRAGDLLGDGRYELLEEAGTGGFATVWKAWDQRVNELVAVKVLHGQHTKDKSRRDRFFRGARRMNQLGHPHIVGVREVEVESEGYLWFVMEYLPGGDLQSAVLNGTLSQREALERVLEVGKALEYAHGKGLVHRDVKPGNILLCGEGWAKLTDFDLVKAADSTGGTRTGAMGSFLFAAPEAMTSAKTVDERADVYGLAMTAVFCIYGKPLPGEVLWDPGFVNRLDVEPEVCAVLTKGTAKPKDDRFKDIGSFCAELRMVMIEPESEEGLDLKMMPIPAGSFLMGSLGREEGRWEDEGPRHVVTLTGFEMASTPVTQALWESVMGSNPSKFKGERRPVERVSWFDAVRFCNALSERKGLIPAYRVGKGHEPTVTWKQDADGFRLPTEAEWEYACRAGKSTRFWSGNSERALSRVGWFNKNSNKSTHPVGEKPANPWGLHDMHGNVYEWCYDWLVPYTHEACTNPAQHAAGKDRVRRGGAWSNTARYARAAIRNGNPPHFRFDNLGFRLARGPVQ